MHTSLKWSWRLRSLQRLFGMGDQQKATCEDLVTRVQRAGGKLGVFAMGIQGLARRSYPAMGMAVQEELALCAFLQGLRPAHIREHVWIAAPTSFLQALCTVESVEITMASKAKDLSGCYIMRMPRH